MDKQTLSFKQFADKAMVDAGFLRRYARDPLLLKDRFQLEDGLLDKLQSEQALLEAIANSHPNKLAGIAKALFGGDPVAAFGDFRDGGGYKDGFNDNASGGGFVDRYEGPKR